MVHRWFSFLVALLFASVSRAQFSCPPNIDFEQGNYSSWQFFTGSCCPINTLTLSGPVSNRHTLTSGSGVDPYGGFPVVAPGGGNYSLRLGNSSTGAQAERARYYVRVPAGVNNYSLIYRYAVVFENPSHSAAHQPRFEVNVYDSATGALLPCGQYTYVASSGLPGFQLSNTGSQIWYRPWSTASIDLSGQGGKTIAVDFATGDCALGAHFGYGYLDLSCSLFQITSVNCLAAPTTTLNAPPGFQVYQWYNANFSPVGTGQSVTVPTPSATTQYHVVLTPYVGYGCPDTLTTTVSVSSLTLQVTNDTFICGGGSVQLHANATSTSSTINYSWSPATGLSCTNCANPIATVNTGTTYYVTVSDGNGCNKTDSVRIEIGPTATAMSQNVLCYNDTTGSATIQVSQGKSPYAYNWNTTPVQTTASATGLSAGSYMGIVTDANGCTDTVTVHITQPSALVVTASATDISCYGSGNGTANAMVTGGVSPYAYQWNTTPVQTGSSVSNLLAGSYVVSVTDQHNCVSTDTVLVNQPLALNVQISSVNHVSCNGLTDGSATVTVTGGRTPYSYSWNTTPVQTTATATGLGAGTYTVTVTDSAGCTDTAMVTITQPGALVATATSTPAGCFGMNTGSVSVNVSGGTTPYTYLWNTTPAQTTASVANLAGGSYSVVVTDSNGCSTTATTTVHQPAAVLSAAAASVTDVSCYGGNNGSATINASGGTAPYSYQWNTTPAQTTATASGLSAGTYTVTVTDSFGCTDTAVVTITQSTSLAVTVTSTPVGCFGMSTGSASVNVSGGKTPYTYSWNTTPAQTTPFANNLPAGSYTVVVTDSNGCTDTASATINQPVASLSATTTSITDISCYGDSNGSVTITATGGTAPYNYSWNTTPVQTSATAAGLGGGTYTVYVSDANGCADTVSVTLTQPASGISVIVDSLNHLRCYTDNSGSVSVIASGGTLPYTYTWNTVPAQVGSVATGLGSGTYTVTVTDGNGCSVNQSVTLNQPTALNASIAVSSPVTCHGAGNGILTASATGGTAPYSYNWNTVPVQTTATASGLGAGSYTVYVSDVNGCIDTAQLVVTEPSALTATLTTQPILCFGGTGGATVVASGGTSPYGYSWNTNPIQTTGILSGVVAGTYVVTISDSLNCQRQDTVVLTQPSSGVQIQIDSIGTVSCFGGSDGGVWTSVTGGTAPYSYLWTPGFSQTAVLTGVTAGNYVLIATDVNGCSDTALAVIGEHAPLVISAQGVKGTCPGLSEGEGGVTVSGGTAPYSYLWSTVPAQSTPTVSGLPAGTYTVTVRDSLNCSQSTTITIQSFPQPLISAGQDTVLCPGETVRLQATGGMTYHWYPETEVSCAVCADAEVSPKQTMEFMVAGMDANGCRDTARVNVIVLERGWVSVGEDVSICEGGSAQLSAFGGESYVWLSSERVSAPEQSHPTVFPERTTTYQVVIRQNRCFTDTLSQTVYVHPLPTIDLGPDIRGAAGSLVTLRARTTDASSIEWSPYEGLSCTDCYEPQLILEKDIRYRATVTSDAGCSAYDEIDISVGCDNSVLFMPNTFTPNGDGNNDMYYPVGRGIRKVLRFEIYSRWGELMYSVRNASVTESGGWDGTYKGEKLTPDVFVYLVEVECLNGDTIKAKGDVSLIR